MQKRVIENEHVQRTSEMSESTWCLGTWNKHNLSVSEVYYVAMWTEETSYIVTSVSRAFKYLVVHVRVGTLQIIILLVDRNAYMTMRIQYNDNYIGQK